MPACFSKGKRLCSQGRVSSPWRSRWAGKAIMPARFSKGKRLCSQGRVSSPWRSRWAGKAIMPARFSKGKRLCSQGRVSYPWRSRWAGKDMMPACFSKGKRLCSQGRVTQGKGENKVVLVTAQRWHQLKYGFTQGSCMDFEISRTSILNVVFDFKIIMM